MIPVESLEREMKAFSDAAVDACDAHLMDLMTYHKPKTGELYIPSSGHYKRFNGQRFVNVMGSAAGMCADLSNG